LDKIAENRVENGPILVIMLPAMAVAVILVEVEVVPCTVAERETRVLLRPPIRIRGR
jgi:hypothetical protein